MSSPAPNPDAQKLKNVLIPTAAAAAVIVLVGLIVGLKNPDEKTAANGPGGTPLDTSPKGMSTDRPPLDSPEWVAIGDGLKKWDAKEGDGPPAKSGANVTIHYAGWLVEGSPTVMFDSSVKQGTPANFDLGNLIPAWQQGIPGMKPGGIRRLYVPSHLGYGAKGAGAGIPPNADLVFEVKLITSK